MLRIEKYATDPYGFPRGDIDPEKKATKEWCMQFAQAFYSLWLRGELMYGWNDMIKFRGLRQLAVGKQPDDLYYEMCYGRDENNQIVRKGMMNVNWEILKVAPKYRNAFVGMFTDVDFDINATSCNPFASQEREEKKWASWISSRVMPEVGVPEQGPAMGDEMPMQPQSIPELEVMESLGLFRLKEELGFEMALKVAFENFSDFYGTVKDKILEDVWDIGRVLLRDYVDISTQKIKVRYADIANSCIRRRTDGTILDGGEFLIMSVADLRAESDFTEEELMRACVPFYGQWGNMTEDAFRRNVGQMNTSMPYGYVYSYFYDSFKIGVLDCEYCTVDEKYTTEVTKGDDTRVYREKFGKVRNSEKRKTKVSKQQTYYRCKWVVGTDMAYDYGLQFDMPRPSKSEARCSFHYAELTTPSPTDVMAPIFHQVQLLWLKFQNASAKSMPDGYAYDEGQLINSTLGGKLTPHELVRMREESGRLYFKTTDGRGRNMLAPNSGAPVYPMPGGMGNAVNEFVACWNLMHQMLMELSGMTPQATAQPLGEKTGLGVSEIQLGATATVLKPCVTAYRNIKLSAAKNLLLRTQIVFQHNEEVAREYYDVMGKDLVEMLKRVDRKTASQYGITLVPRINMAMRQKIEAAALESMGADRNGGVGITTSEFVLIQGLLDNGANPKLIQGALEMFIQRRSKQKEEQAAANSKAQSDYIIQQTQAATEGAIKQEVVKSGLKIKEIFAQAEAQAQVKRAEMAGTAELEAGKWLTTDVFTPLLNEAMGVMQPQQA